MLQEMFECTNGVSRRRKSKKDRQYDGQKKDRQYDGQKTDRQYDGQKTDRQYDGQKTDRQYDGQKTDRQYDGQKKDRQYDGQKDKQRSTKHYTEKLTIEQHKPNKNRGWTQVLRKGEQLFLFSDIFLRVVIFCLFWSTLLFLKYSAHDLLYMIATIKQNRDFKNKRMLQVFVLCNHTRIVYWNLKKTTVFYLIMISSKYSYPFLVCWDVRSLVLCFFVLFHNKNVFGYGKDDPFTSKNSLNFGYSVFVVEHFMEVLSNTSMNSLTRRILDKVKYEQQYKQYRVMVRFYGV